MGKETPAPGPEGKPKRPGEGILADAMMASLREGGTPPAEPEGKPAGPAEKPAEPEAGNIVEELQSLIGAEIESSFDWSKLPPKPAPAKPPQSAQPITLADLAKKLETSAPQKAARLAEWRANQAKIKAMPGDDCRTELLYIEDRSYQALLSEDQYAFYAREFIKSCGGDAQEACRKLYVQVALLNHFVSEGSLGRADTNDPPVLQALKLNFASLLDRPLEFEVLVAKAIAEKTKAVAEGVEATVKGLTDAYIAAASAELEHLPVGVQADIRRLAQTVGDLAVAQRKYAESERKLGAAITRIDAQGRMEKRLRDANDEKATEIQGAIKELGERADKIKTVEAQVRETAADLTQEREASARTLEQLSILSGAYFELMGEHTLLGKDREELKDLYERMEADRGRIMRKNHYFRHARNNMVNIIRGLLPKMKKLEGEAGYARNRGRLGWVTAAAAGLVGLAGILYTRSQTHQPSAPAIVQAPPTPGAQIKPVSAPTFRYIASGIIADFGGDEVYFMSTQKKKEIDDEKEKLGKDVTPEKERDLYRTYAKKVQPIK